MQYLGGKCRIAKPIVKTILDNTPHRERFIEPFMGGGAITSTIADKFKIVYASDSHEDLILMWRALANGWVPPDSVSEEEYKKLRHEESSALRGFTGFGCSFAGKWFGGYARNKINFNYAGAMKRAVLRDIKRMGNVYFDSCDYSIIEPCKGDVVYCDPPYAGTTGYKDKFDNEKFWKVMDTWVEIGASVFVSEYKAPEGWFPVWEKTYSRGLKSDPASSAAIVTDKLWIKR